MSSTQQEARSCRIRIVYLEDGGERPNTAIFGLRTTAIFLEFLGLVVIRDLEGLDRSYNYISVQHLNLADLITLTQHTDPTTARRHVNVSARFSFYIGSRPAGKPVSTYLRGGLKTLLPAKRLSLI